MIALFLLAGCEHEQQAILKAQNMLLPQVQSITLENASKLKGNQIVSSTLKSPTKIQLKSQPPKKIITSTKKPLQAGRIKNFPDLLPGLLSDQEQLNPITKKIAGNEIGRASCRERVLLIV